MNYEVQQPVWLFKSDIPGADVKAGKQGKQVPPNRSFKHLNNLHLSVKHVFKKE